MEHRITNKIFEMQNEITKKLEAKYMKDDNHWIKIDKMSSKMNDVLCLFGFIMLCLIITNVILLAVIIKGTSKIDNIQGKMKEMNGQIRKLTNENANFHSNLIEFFVDDNEKIRMKLDVLSLKISEITTQNGMEIVVKLVEFQKMHQKLEEIKIMNEQNEAMEGLIIELKRNATKLIEVNDNLKKGIARKDEMEKKISELNGQVKEVTNSFSFSILKIRNIRSI
jgi:hypothetical protein